MERKAHLVGLGHVPMFGLERRSVVVQGFAESVQPSANTSLVALKRSVVEEMLMQRFRNMLSTRSDSEIAAMVEQDVLKDFPEWVLEGKSLDSGGPSSRILIGDGGKGKQIDGGKDKSSDLLMNMGTEEADFSSVSTQDDVSSVADGGTGQQGGSRSLERLIDVDSLVDFSRLSGSPKDIAVPIMAAGFVVMAFSVAVSLLLRVLDGNRDDASGSKDAVRKNGTAFNGPMRFFTDVLSKKDDDHDDDGNVGKADASLAVDSKQDSKRQEITTPSTDPYTMYTDHPDIARSDGGILWKRKEDVENQTNVVYGEKEEADLWRIPLEELRSDHANNENGSSVVEYTAETTQSFNTNDNNEIESEQEELRPRRKPSMDILDNAEQTIVSPRRRG